MPCAVFAPYFCMEIPIEHYLINSIPNCLHHHVGPPLDCNTSERARDHRRSLISDPNDSVRGTCIYT